MFRRTVVATFLVVFCRLFIFDSLILKRLLPLAECSTLELFQTVIVLTILSCSNCKVFVLTRQYWDGE